MHFYECKLFQETKITTLDYLMHHAMLESAAIFLS